MGNYAVQADIEAEVSTTTLAQLTTDSGTSPDSAKIANAIALSEIEIDSSLAKRIATPVNLSLFPDLANWLKGLTVPIAIKRLYGLRGICPPEVKTAWQTARAEIAAYVAGDRAAPGATTPASTASDGPEDEWGYQPLKSGRTNMEGL